MTGKIVNFKQAKKRANYLQKQVQASENRKKFGRSKAERRLDDFEARHQDKHVNAHKLEE